ncbi:MAG: hypothetical protein BGO43_15675 [Gammaproteobacteria bacterium 39-13]|nr:GtrA family protein [Gammaproteobacteria bacterium]OJV87847.1 MAG: hypothetical protein BGO43_15675 [Gammaproteobacteria bacterium 39-13]
MRNFVIKLAQDPKLYQYLVVGGISAIVDITLFLLLRQHLQIHYLMLATMSFVVATFVNYILCNRFVFIHRQKHSSKTRFILTYVVSGVGLFIHHSALFLAFEGLGLPLAMSKIAAMGTAFGWNFLSRKYFVFKPESFSHST